MFVSFFNKLKKYPNQINLYLLCSARGQKAIPDIGYYIRGARRYTEGTTGRVGKLYGCKFSCMCLKFYGFFWGTKTPCFTMLFNSSTFTHESVVHLFMFDDVGYYHVPIWVPLTEDVWQYSWKKCFHFRFTVIQYTILWMVYLFLASLYVFHYFTSPKHFDNMK